MVNVNCELKNRYLSGDDVTRSLGVELTTEIMSQVLCAVFGCNGKRRTPGLAGQLIHYKVAAENTLQYEFLDGSFLPTSWPGEPRHERYTNECLPTHPFPLFLDLPLTVVSRCMEGRITVRILPP